MSVSAPTVLTGLTQTEVQDRIASGETNTQPNSAIRSIWQIIFVNVFNPVNAIMITLFVLILVAKSPKDALFVGVVFSNSVIGIFTELHARKKLEELEVLSAAKATVIRDGTKFEIPTDEVVKDDTVELKSGDQVVVDGEIIDSTGLELDESLLTGESDYIAKEIGDEAMSGSFVAAGSGYLRATKVGAASFANTLSEEAKQFTLVGSELKKGINKVLKVLMFLIPPTGALLFWVLIVDDKNGWQDDLRASVGAAVAMVPDGLVLLTSLAFMAGVITLATKHKALASELASVELLARVDVLCLDKTGTITTGAIAFGGVEVLEGQNEEFVAKALGAFSGADPNPNATMNAVAQNYDSPKEWDTKKIIPFSSARKWSAVEFEEQGLFFFGAPDVLASVEHHVQKQVATHTEQGRRVLMLCNSSSSAKSLEESQHALPNDISPIALILLEDEIRDDAIETFDLFQKRGVKLIVISGDTVNTVSVVAERAGITGASNFIDARELPDDIEALAKVLEEKVVFGRVAPQQKKAMVEALQSKGHMVAMTGDGVNDVLALKEADMGISMGSGSAATRSVAQIVLTENKFSALPNVLVESRKVINNVERVAKLFITKAIYAVLITLGIAIATTDFPFLPRHLTLIGTFSIGLPGLVLALSPSAEKVEKGFLKRALKFALPAGIIAASGTGIAYGLALSDSAITLVEARTVATFTLLGIGLFILLVSARPFQFWKLGLSALMAMLYMLILLLPFSRDYFELDIAGVYWIWGAVAIIILIGGILTMAIPLVMKNLVTAPDDNSTQTLHKSP